MAEKSSSKVICENTENISEKQEKQQNHPNPLISLFQNFRIFFPSKPQQETKEVDAAAVVVSQEVEDGSTSLKKNPDVVRFSDARPIVPPPMKLESEEYEQITSPAVMWQVCIHYYYYSSYSYSSIICLA